jgi:hypothetical protein
MAAAPATATHYSVVYDPDQVLHFSEIFRPAASTWIAHVVSFLCREKCAGMHLRGANPQLSHFIVTSRHAPEQFLRQLMCLESPVGSYVVESAEEGKLGEIPVPVGSTAVYMSLNPKNMLTGWNLTVGQVNDFYRSVVERNFGGTNLDVSKLESVFRSNVHKSTAEKIYVDLDVDTKEETQLCQVKDILRPIVAAIDAIIETRGGYHVVLRKAGIKAHHKALYEFSKKATFPGTARDGKTVTKHWFSLASEDGDAQVPVPGTLQGGFKVRFVDVEAFMKAAAE